jgi:hypothetical protein
MNLTKKALLPLSSLFLLAGCGVGIVPGTSTSTSPVTVAAGFKGRVMGGQQPVVGIALQVYAVGVTGYASAATPLLPAAGTAGAITTDTNGNFNLPALTCPASNSLIYLVGTGGQPIAAVGATPAVTNNNLSLMAAIGTCSNFGGLNFINMNELTTVASVWALSPFMTGITHIGAPPISASTPTVPSLGITNAFASVNKLVNTNLGTLATAPANTTLPIASINTLADILENCVNSAGISYSGCSNLFHLAGSAAGTGTSTDTVTAAMLIAQNPSTQVSALNMLRSASPVFTSQNPTSPYNVNNPPTDWSLVVTYSGGGLNSPQGIAADQSGNIWVANAGNSSVSEFSPAGTALSPSNGFTSGGINAPYALAVDQSGYVWVANSGNNTITKLITGTNGTSYGNSTTLSTPKGIAIDGSGNVWVSNSGNSTVSAFTTSGTAITGSPFSGAGITTPVAIAINPK